MIKKIKLILWDFGGVLTESPIKKFIEFEKENNLTPGTLVKINSHNKMNNAWAKLEKDLVNEKEFTELFLEEAKNLNIKEEIDTNMVLNCLDVKLDKAMLDIFFKIKDKVPFACLTNNIPSHLNKNYNNTFENFKHNFEYVFESSKLGLRKPEEKMYKHVIQKIKLPPENILFIDDLGINLKPAKKLGFFTYKYVNITDTKNFLENILGDLNE